MLVTKQPDPICYHRIVTGKVIGVYAKPEEDATQYFIAVDSDCKLLHGKRVRIIIEDDK